MFEMIFSKLILLLLINRNVMSVVLKSVLDNVGILYYRYLKRWFIYIYLDF